ncbi:unnamed protein product [Cuscuta campestris]|uniref:Transposase (putative) gypsy type domain-containing protein n=1 Tax=Cuscuta campestris TaxID=132261 RepID=A0A484LR52_9ASTE|nr:unnamed protein product [Cuscuta campestris]
MSSQSSVFRRSASERDVEGSVTGSVQESDSRLASVEEIVEAVEIPLQSEPRKQRRTALEDSGIRARKCTLTAEEFRKAKRLASAPGVTVRRPTPEQSVFDAPSGFFAIHLKSLEYGFRFPLHQLVIDFFQHFDLLPCQVMPKSHRYLAGFLIRCQRTGVRPDLARFLLLFQRRADEAHVPGRSERQLAGSSLGRLSPTPPVKPTSKTTQKKRKETASAADALQGSVSPMMKDCGHPKYVKAAFPARVSFTDRDYVPETFLRSFTPPTDRAKLKDVDRETLASDTFHELGSAMMRMVDMSQRLRASVDDRSRAYVEIADLNEALKAAKEQARQAEERAQQLAEEAARNQAVAEFLASDAFQEEAFTRMNDLLKAWGQTPEGQAFARSEGTSWYNLGLFRAQQVLSDRFLAGEDFPEPCDNPDELNTSNYYPNGGNSAGEQPSAE